VALFPSTKGMNKISRSVVNSVKGIKLAYFRDLSFRMEIWAGFLVGLFIFYFSPLTSTELIFVVLAYVLVLTAELINTSLEQALEHIHPHIHEKIGASKDIASGAVFMTVAFAFFVLYIIAHGHGFGI
jgi:diacylglycerol kinase (ATP)